MFYLAGLLLTVPLWFCYFLMKTNIGFACIVSRNGRILQANKNFNESFTGARHIGDITKEYKNDLIKDNLGKVWQVRQIDFWAIKILVFKLEYSWINQVPFPMFVIDREGRVLQANKSLFMQVGDLVQSYIPKTRLRDWNVLLQNAKKDWSNIEVLWPDGELVKLFVTLQNDQLTVLLQTDAENLRQVAQRAQNLQLLGSLTASIVHDFSNFLTAINGFCYLKDQDSYENIQATADKAHALTTQLLELARTNQNQASCDVTKIINQSLPLLNSMCMHSIDIKTKLTQQECKTNITSSQILQIITNFVLNAKEAGGKNVTILLQREQCSKKLRSGFVSGEFIVLSVQDDGPGISHEHDDKILKLFFTTKDTGSGIGLASIARMLTIQGGGIDFISNPSYTVFSAYIPILVESAKANRTKTILFAEDDDLVRQLTVKALQKSGYNIIACENGQQALDKLDANVDIVLTDAIMPVLNGVQLALKIRELDAKLPILLMSGIDSQELAQHLPKNITILTKPLQIKKLIEVLAKVK